MKFYKIISSSGYVLSNRYEKAAEMVLGYGGVWCKDHRKAKKFNSIAECKKEINRMHSGKYLVVSNKDNWREEYEKAFGTR